MQPAYSKPQNKHAPAGGGYGGAAGIWTQDRLRPRQVSYFGHVDSNQEIWFFSLVQSKLDDDPNDETAAFGGRWKV